MYKYLVLSVIIITILSCEKKILETTFVVSITELISPTESNIRSLSLSDEGDILIATEKGVFKSSNNGIDWDEVPFFKDKKCSKILQLPNTCLVSSGRDLYLSTNNGLDWSSCNLYDKHGSQNRNQITDFKFSNQRGYLVTTGDYSPCIYRSNNSGKSWFCSFDPDTDINFAIDYLSVVSIIDSNTIVCSGDGNLYSVNKGSSWEVASGFGYHQIVDAHYLSIDTVNFGRGTQAYYLSENYSNHGKVGFKNIKETYENISTSDFNYLYKKIRFNDINGGVIVGEKAILKKQDQTWVYYYNYDGTTIPHTYNDFQFINENLIIAVGDSGVISKIQF